MFPATSREMARITASDKTTSKLEPFDLHAREGPMWLMSDFESLIFIELIVSTVALAVVVAVAR